MKKRNLIIAIIVVVLIVGLVFGLTKLNKGKSKKEDKNNYTIKYSLYGADKKLQQRVTFIYEKKKLTDITLTLYFEDKDTAKSMYNQYKKINDFRKYETKSNRVILYYNYSDVDNYKLYSQEELDAEFTAEGFVLTK